MSKMVSIKIIPTDNFKPKKVKHLKSEDNTLIKRVLKKHGINPSLLGFE